MPMHELLAQVVCPLGHPEAQVRWQSLPQAHPARRFPLKFKHILPRLLQELHRQGAEVRNRVHSILLTEVRTRV